MKEIAFIYPPLIKASELAKELDEDMWIFDISIKPAEGKIGKQVDITLMTEEELTKEQ